MTQLSDLWHICYPHQLVVENPVCSSRSSICDPNLVDLVCPRVSTLACEQRKVSVPLLETQRVQNYVMLTSRLGRSVRSKFLLTITRTEMRECGAFCRGPSP